MQRAALAALSLVAACAFDDGCGCQRTEPASVVVVPLEVADDEALSDASDWLALPSFGSGRYVQQSSAERASSEGAERSLWERGNRDFNNFICRGAEAHAPDSRVPFRFDLERCPEAYLHGLVLGRFTGSGRLSRLWLTALSLREGPADDELVRVYVDDDPLPRIEAQLAEMLTGSTELFAPPFGAGSARVLAWYYPVVFSKKLIVTLDGTATDDLYFHQTDVVLDARTHERTPASERLARRDAAKDALEGRTKASTPETSEMVVGAGEHRELELRGPRTLTEARIRFARADLAALANTRLRVTWDGSREPGIDVSLADLFATWREPPRPSGLVLGSSDLAEQVEVRLSLPMPFEERAVWALESTPGAGPISLGLTVSDSMPRRPWGHLHVERNESSRERGASTHPLASATGRGRLVGICGDLSGHGVAEDGGTAHPFQFLEGDESLGIDGQHRGGGTGTEDLFDGAFYFEDGPFATPYAQAWAISVDSAGSGHVSACRWHGLGDAIDFEVSLDLGLEVGPGMPSVLERYRTVAFLYR